MTYRGLYNSALRIVSELEEDTFNEDYEERAAYILATFCNVCAPIDKSYRTANHLAAVTIDSVTEVDLNRDIPFHEIFAPAAVYYLGAMLVSDENEALSDRLFALYSDAIATIQSGLPCSKHSIVNHYADQLS